MHSNALKYKESIARLLRERTDIDQLVIETSGVTDPVTLISTLEEKFGVMYRVRLDCVLAVVNTST